MEWYPCFMFSDSDPSPTPVAKDQVLPTTLAYGCGLLGLVGGFPWIIGVIMAYVFKDSCPAWIATHYRLQIRTFWIGLTCSIVAAPLCLVIVGFFLLGAIWLWATIRLGRGLLYLVKGEPHPAPATWGIG